MGVRPLLFVAAYLYGVGAETADDHSCTDTSQWPESKVSMLVGRADMGSPSRPDVEAALTESQGNVGKAAAVLRRRAENPSQNDASSSAAAAAAAAAGAAAARALQTWNASDRGTAVIVDDFVSAVELRHLVSMFDAAQERGVTRWEHGEIKGPAGSVGHTSAGLLIDYRADGDAHAAIGPATRAAFCAVRQRMLECARAVGADVLLPRGRRPPALEHGPVITPDYTALLQYRPGGRHDRHVDTDVSGRCLSMALHLNDGFGGGQFQAWDWRGVRTANTQADEVESLAGRLVLFLSETPHAVMPITHGPDRRAMFVWLSCMELRRNENERQLCS